MRPYSVILNLLLIAGLVFSGCEKGIEKEGVPLLNENSTGYAEDIRFLTDRFGFTEEELLDIDAAKFIDDYQLRTREYAPEQVRRILELQREAYRDDGTAVIFRILQAEGRTLKEGDEVEAIGLYLNPGTLVQRAVFDLENNVFYMDSAEPRPMRADSAASLRDLPERRGIAQWEAYTSGEEEPSTGSFRWKLVFQLTGGEYGVYEGYTGDMSHLPPSFHEVIADLKAATAP